MNTADEITVETVSHTDPRTIEAAVDLGDLSRDTLGLLPRAVYADAAAKGCFLAVRHRSAGRVVGDVLFRLSRDDALFAT